MSESLLTFSNLELFLAGITSVLFFIQLFYYLFIYARLIRMAKKNGRKVTAATGKQSCQPVSVIVYAHGKPEDLQENLPAILNQDYPDYEVIVVNDGSDVECEDVLKRLSTEYKNLYYTYVPVETKYLSHKKLALTMGIKAAKHEILLFTEADCRPVSPKWITRMADTYDPETHIVLGFCAYQHTQGFFHKLIAYDNLTTGLQMLSSALLHHPYTGNGRNLSYRRPLFFARKGYAQSLYLHAGSDDLFINEAATGTNTQVQYAPDALTKMSKIEDTSSWKEMKIARAATGHYYKGYALWFYRMDLYSYLLFFPATIALFVTGLSGNVWTSVTAGLLLLFRFATKMVVFRQSAILLQQKPQTAWLPVLEIVQPVYTLYIHVYRLFKWRNDFTSKI